MVLGTLWGLHPEAPIEFQGGGRFVARPAELSEAGMIARGAGPGCLEGPTGAQPRPQEKTLAVLGLVLGRAEKPDCSIAPFFRPWSEGLPEMDLKM